MSIIRSVLNAPRQFFRKMVAHPIKTGAVALAADQLSKLAVSSLPQKVKYCIASGIFCIQHIKNENFAFGTAYEYSTSAKLLFIGGTLSLAGLFVKAKSKLTKLATALMVGGGAGNLIERFANGHVTDFIKIGSWYNFNLADASITAGGLLLVYEALSGTKEQLARPTKLQALKSSFTKNILNTLGQTFLYTLALWSATGLIAPIPAVIFSLIRDVRHRGERMF